MDAESFYDYDLGDIFEIFQSGGGGYGNPLRRSIEKVKEDVHNEVVTIEKARNDYGVVILPDTLEIDLEETLKLREVS